MNVCEVFFVHLHKNWKKRKEKREDELDGYID